MKNPSKALYIFISILIAQSAGAIGSIFTSSNIETWYQTLNTPSWNPPSWLFGPVWITLYTLMGIAAYLVWKNKKNIQKKLALKLYGFQLLLNATWSIAFFGMQNPELAFANILILDGLILLTLISFWKINKTAALLLAPYLAWVSFASALNYSIWQLNI